MFETFNRRMIKRLQAEKRARDLDAVADALEADGYSDCGFRAEAAALRDKIK